MVQVLHELNDLLSLLPFLLEKTAPAGMVGLSLNEFDDFFTIFSVFAKQKQNLRVWYDFLFYDFYDLLPF